MSNPLKISYNGNDFLLDVAEGKLVSLNAIYEIVGSPINKEPYEWKRLPQTQELIEALTKKLNVAKIEIIKTSRARADRGGGTWSHWQLAIEYAIYLGGAEFKIALTNAILDFNLVLKALQEFEVSDEILEDCKCPLYVYAIREVDTGNVKIGISKDPEERLKQLQTANSSKLELIGFNEAKNRFLDERIAHKNNKEHHIHGEWFSRQASLEDHRKS